eukprot:6175601-Pleurochrysis_carterae.AAC.2
MLGARARSTAASGRPVGAGTGLRWRRDGECAVALERSTMRIRACMETAQQISITNVNIHQSCGARLA